MIVQPIVPQPLDADAFYAERDSRSALEHRLADLQPQRIAIVVPQVSYSRFGIENALFWTASIIRRMGRPFAELILVADPEFRQSSSTLVGAGQASVEQVISHELRAADPFAGFEWRTAAENVEFGDAAAVVWLGTPPMAAPHARTLAINAHGWVAALNEAPLPNLSLSPPDFDAAPAAISMSACMAAARLFSQAFSKLQRPAHVVLALDAGTGSTDPALCGTLLSKGTGRDTATPWNGKLDTRPSLTSLLVVSAGGIGGNVCRIMRDSFLHVGTAYVLDPDTLEISNLNRAIGFGMSNVGASKAALAADSLRFCTNTATAVQKSYEDWITAEMAEQFRRLRSAVVVGVDQVRTRLTVGSDWPWMLLNGATAGATLSAGIHIRSSHGCIGCWYGQDDASFLATRTPMACAAGVAPGTMELRPAAGYPFVSVAAAAQLVAFLARVSEKSDAWPEYAGTVVSMSIRSPECAQARQIPVSERCLLLCAADYVYSVLGRTGNND